MEIINLIQESSFKSILAVVTILSMVLLILVFIWGNLKRELMKILGILSVLGLALAANSGPSYFLAIIILATLVTNLDFLQNIAAIIRNNEFYFKYGIQNRKDIEKRIEKEQEEIEQEIQEETEEEIQEVINESNKKIPTNDLHINEISLNLNNSIEFGLLVERKTFEMLEERYGTRITKYVKFGMGNGKRLEVDGIITTRNKMSLIEIKATRKKYMPPQIIEKSVHRFIDSLNSLNKKSDMSLELIIIVVGDISHENELKILSRIKKIDCEFNIKCEFYNLLDIGISEN